MTVFSLYLKHGRMPYSKKSQKRKPLDKVEGLPFKFHLINKFNYSSGGSSIGC